jgi:hypothetical protein
MTAGLRPDGLERWREGLGIFVERGEVPGYGGDGGRARRGGPIRCVASPASS